MFFKKTITKEEKVQALKTAVDWWNKGYYAKSQELCKKYGISAETFSKALIAFKRNGGKW